MIHRPLYKKTPWCGTKVLLITLLLLGGAYYLYRQYAAFNSQRIVENSELKSQTFAVQPEEIVAPQSKLKAYLLEERSNPIISINFIFDGAGKISEKIGQEGIGRLLAAMLNEGTGKYDSEAWKEELENKAIGLSFSAGEDDFKGSLLTTRENAATAFEMLKMALTEPRFASGDLQKNKNIMLEDLRRQREHPADVLDLEFDEFLFKDHPYGRNPLGKADDINKLKAEDLRQYAKNSLTRDKLIIGIAGDIDASAGETMIDEVFGKLPTKTNLPVIAKPEPQTCRLNRKIEHETGQNMVIMAAPGAGRNEVDFYPLFVANYIIGGSGLSSRLSKTIREDKGLTYGVYSYLSLADQAPLLKAGFSTTAENYDEAMKLFEQQWQLFGAEGATEAELEQAKNFLTASYNLRFASISNLAEILTAMQKYNLGRDFLQKRNQYIEQVTLKEVNAAAKKYFNEDNLAVMSIGRFSDETKEKN